ncbi:sulfurtransferase complex subunit TusC [Alkalimarinus sediminis]|uniref:Sulfurtransferase complex subunit TusC n=1 Tax=Alkalimarinus sediminis TaxID=1632866 RepID=A0A9E8HP01_9ALTE|nr:sulfurtransferase complex subunit TusC [Alkalimarinus sediminis]UZW76098.1 sulfurtransferase complex subunit TusC [Alkalimarinus sediminis]
MREVSRKKIVVILSQSPYGGSLAREAIDYCLAAAAFEQDLQLIFTSDAVLQLLNDQQPQSIHQKNISKTLSALPIYGVDNFYVDQEALADLGLSEKDLCLPVSIVNANEMTELLANASHTLNF